MTPQPPTCRTRGCDRPARLNGAGRGAHCLGCLGRSPKILSKTRAGRKRRQEVMARDRHRCVACGATEGLTIDHIDGGLSPPRLNALGNLQVLCARCNAVKGTRTLSWTPHHSPWQPRLFDSP